MRRLIIAVSLVIATTLPAQTPPQPTPNNDPPFWPVLVDPVCPVSVFMPSPPPNITRNLRVMYFPTSPGAKLKDPQSPTLQIAFNGPRFVNNHASIPFIRKDDYWEAILPLERYMASYAVFYVKDGPVDIDDNNGQYWDISFCSPSGARQSVLYEAESYTGETWPLGIHRAKDLNKAISILENSVAQRGAHNSQVLTELWNLKAKRGGGDAKAYAEVAKEVEDALAKESSDRMYLYGAENFVLEHPNDLPPAVVDRIATVIDGDRPKKSDSMRAAVAFNRAGQEADPKKRLEMLAKVMAEFPAAAVPDDRELARFMTYIQLEDASGAQVSLTRYRTALAESKSAPDPSMPLNCALLAELYIGKGVGLDAAMRLLDDASEILNGTAARGDLAVGPEYRQSVESRLAKDHARVYLALHQPALALTFAETAVVTRTKDASTHEILAMAYAAIGSKQKALDEYFEAALLPSNYDLKYQGELKRYYLKNFGSEKKYTAELNRRIDERFQATNYVPSLLNRPAPALGFTTLKGEKFDGAALDGKTVVLNFWSPG